MFNRIFASFVLAYVKWLWIIVLTLLITSFVYGVYTIHPILTPCILILDACLCSFLVIFNRDLIRAILLDKFDHCPKCNVAVLTLTDEGYVTCGKCNFKV